LERASAESFARPHDLVLSPNGRFLYVADLGNHLVKVLDPMTLEVLGAFGQGELSSPHDVAFDNQGRLLVADTGNDRIAAYEVEGAEGRLVESWSEGLHAPEGVAPAPDGLVYVANAAGHNVVALAAGKVVHEAGTRGQGAAQFVRPHDIDLDRQGRIYVGDPGNDRIQILDRKLRYLGTLGGPAYDFNEPKYFDLDAGNRLIVADEYNHQIKILGQDRRLVAVIGSGERGKGPNRFNQPEGVESSGESLWVSDTRNNRILRFRVSYPP
jgi:DNA-binding beta-propeller fold protein YncE